MNLGTDSTDARRADVSEETKYLRNIAVGVEEVHGPAGIGVLAVKLASLALTSDFDGFCDLIDNSGDQVAGNLGNEAFVKLLVSGINVGIDQHSGRCAQALGTWFYNGYVVPQSYEGAEHCYALADKWGNSQGTVNLGYIYYYGRTGERDYARAFQLFSKAVATDDNPEGLWKLGDMWHKGLFVEKDEVAAFSCYRRARDLCKSDATLGARAAHHMADMLLSGVRDADGVIRVETERLKPIKEKPLIFRVPFVRGAINFFSSLVTGTKILMRSASVYGEEEPSKFEKWLSEKLKINVYDLIMFIGVALGLALSVGLFVILPQFLANLISDATSLEKSGIWYNLIIF